MIIIYIYILGRRGRVVDYSTTFPKFSSSDLDLENAGCSKYLWWVPRSRYGNVKAVELSADHIIPSNADFMLYINSTSSALWFFGFKMLITRFYIFILMLQNIYDLRYLLLNVSYSKMYFVIGGVSKSLLLRL